MDTPGGTLYRLPTEYFLQHVLPPLPRNIDPNRILVQLRRSGSKFHRAITKQGRWRGFSQNPDSTTLREAESFRHFPDIVKAIAKAGARHGLRPSLQLIEKNICWPRSDKRSTEPEQLALPQIYMVRHDVIPQEATWGDFAITGWFRKSYATEWRIDVSKPYGLEILLTYNVQNRENMVAGMIRCMRVVPRRFSFGFTVSNARMECWYYDRSQILVSNAIDWITVSMSRRRLLWFC